MEKILIFIDISRIEKELINSKVLVENKIEPYYSLHCLGRVDYDIRFCLPCPRISYCFSIFIKNNYLINWDII